MKSIARQLFFALAAASLSTAVLAGGKGGGSAGAGAAAGGAHMSAKGQANTNSRFAKERQLGQDRAAARRNAQGTAHEKGSTASSGSQGPKTLTGAPLEAGSAAKPAVRTL
jgi:hypothetical protein